MKKIIICLAVMLCSMFALLGCSCSNSNGVSKSSNNNYSNNASSNNSTSNSNNVSNNNSINSSSGTKSNSTSSQQNIKSAIIGKWTISTISNPDYFSASNGNMVVATDKVKNGYKYLTPPPNLNFKENGRIINLSGFDIYTYEIKDDETVVAKDYATRGTSDMGGEVITFKYDKNNNTLTVVDYTNSKGEVITNNGAYSTSDRSKVVGDVYSKD